MPGISWWPGTIEPGVVSGIGSTMDLFVTAASLAGVELPADRRKMKMRGFTFFRPRTQVV